MPEGTADGGNKGGDLVETYNRIFYRVNPQYEVVLIGEYPQARYLSVSPYDDHWAIVDYLYDYQIAPLQQSYQNPFQPGVGFKEDQLYAITFQLGGTQPSSGQIAPGCQLDDANIHANVFDVTKRHPGMSWNGTPDLPGWVQAHSDGGPSQGGDITIRRGAQGEDGGNLHLASPVMIVRDLSNGCAVPALNAVLQAGQTETPQSVLTESNAVAVQWNWLNGQQIYTHKWYKNNYEVKMCFPQQDPSNKVVWFGSAQYIPAPSPDVGYLLANLPPNAVSSLLSGKGFMRIRFKLPAVGNLPCAGCSLTGTEQVRYLSVSFSDQSTTLATVDDSQIVTDSEGNASLIVGFGAAPPSYVTAANHYTWVDLSKTSGISGLTRLTLRTVLPSQNFQCSANAVPYDYMEYNPLGGYMGGYVPVVDFVSAGQIPQIPTPVQGANSCGLTPPPPAVCSDN